MCHVAWGPLGFKEQYITQLRRRSWLTLALSLATAVLIVGALYVSFNGLWSYLWIIITAAWAYLLIILGGLLGDTNERLHAFETYLNFYDHRHAVRHDLYCKHHLHCIALHYFDLDHKVPHEES